MVDVVLVMVEIILDLKQAEKCEGEHAKENVGAEVVHYMSISILSIFLIEIALKVSFAGRNMSGPITVETIDRNHWSMRIDKKRSQCINH